MSILGVALSGIWLIIAVAIAVFIVWKLGKVIFGLITNAVLGLITFFIFNAAFSLNIPYNILTILVAAILGLPGTALIVLLSVLGITSVF